MVEAGNHYGEEEVVEEMEGVFFFPPDLCWRDNLGLLTSSSFPWITGFCFASSNLKQILL